MEREYIQKKNIKLIQRRNIYRVETNIQRIYIKKGQIWNKNIYGKGTNRMEIYISKNTRKKNIRLIQRGDTYGVEIYTKRDK